MTITVHPNLIDYCHISLLIEVSSANFAEPNFRFRMEITVGTATYTDYSKPDSTGKAIFNISRFVQQLFTTAIYTEPTDILTETQLLKPYQYQAFTEYGTPRIQQEQTSIETKYAINGAAPPNYITAQLAEKRFLTNQPRVKNVESNDSELLYFPVAPEYYSIKVGITYYINSLPTTIYSNSYSRYYSQRIIYQLACGFTQLGLNTLPNADAITHYSVAIYTSAGTQISETFLFRLIPNKWRFKRTFIFRNSFGMYDTLRTFGNSDESENYNRNTYSNSTRTINYHNSYSERMNIRTGFHLHQTEEVKHYSYYFVDFLMSNEVYLQARNNWHRIRITNAESLRQSEPDALLKREIEIEFADTHTYIAIDIATQFPYYHDLNHDINHD